MSPQSIMRRCSSSTSGERAKMGREPKASTLNTHNSAMNRVFEEAVARGFIAHKSVPLMVNRGEKSERRPDFTREEYAT